MVRHDDVFIDMDFGSHIRGTHPFFMNDAPKSVQAHRLINDLSKKNFATIRANRDEIRSGRGIIPIPQAHRTPAPPARLAITLIALGSHRSFQIQN
jgi:hypothetical protein